MEPPAVERGDDLFLWKNASGGFGKKFSSKVTWNCIRIPSPLVSWSKVIWFKEEIPRCSFISWLAIQQRLPTRDRLLSWGLSVPDCCVLCTLAPESHVHMFFTCPFVRRVWLRFCGRHLAAPPDDIRSAVALIQHQSQPSQSASTTILKLLLQVIVYTTWRERNARIFRNESLSDAAFFHLVDRTLRDRLLSFPYPPTALFLFLLVILVLLLILCSFSCSFSLVISCQATTL